MPKQAFPTTSWTLVLGARAGQRQSALQQLCKLYWPPVHAFILGQVRQPEEADDLTQEFFTSLIEKHALASVRPDVARFRSFLLAAVRHFLSNHWDREHARKRGGGQAPLPLDADGECRAGMAADCMTPERVFERNWALLLLERALATVRCRCAETGHEQEFELLKGCLTGEGQKIRYEEAAAVLGSSESAVKAMVYRMRRQWGEALRAEVGQTVADPAEVDGELRYLFSVLSR